MSIPSKREFDSLSKLLSGLNAKELVDQVESLPLEAEAIRALYIESEDLIDHKFSIIYLQQNNFRDG